MALVSRWKYVALGAEGKMLEWRIRHDEMTTDMGYNVITWTHTRPRRHHEGKWIVG